MKHVMHKMPNGKMMSDKKMKKMGKKKMMSLRDMPMKY